MSILIKNGSVVTSTQSTKADVLVENDRIAKIEACIDAAADTTIDAEGQFVLPGGIDPHVHLQLPTPAGCSSDGFESGSIAALYGGTTTLIDFVTPSRGQSLISALDERIAEAKNCLCDYSFHVSPVDWHTGIEGEMLQCISRGFTSFKVYLAYKDTVGISDQTLHNVMQIAAQNGAMVTAHCELDDKIKDFSNKYFADGCVAPYFHKMAHAPATELAAIKGAIKIAQQTGCPLYVVHVSVGGSLKHIALAQQNGQPVYAETCPHYLLLDDSVYEGDFDQTVKYVLSPPLRTKRDQDELWLGVQNKTIQTIGTDHCPFSLAQKSVGKDDFRKIPNGGGGIEHRLELLYTYGVLQNRISMNRMVDILSTQPAKIFGLKHKGEVAVGFDADLVIWNPNHSKTISAQTHHSTADISIFEGYRTQGVASTVIKSGKIAIQNATLNTGIDKGKLLFRNKR